MGQEKRLGKSAICPQCRCTRFFAVNFNRTPEIVGNQVAVPVNCEKCNRQLFWMITCREWVNLKAEHDKAKKAPEKKNA